VSDTLLAEDRKNNNNNTKNNKIWYDLKDHNIAPKQWISIRNIIIYLETKLCPNRRIFVIIIIILSFFCQKCVRHISRPLLNGNQWSLTGMLNTMSRSADYFRNFQNGRHGNHKKPQHFSKCSELDETFQNFCLTCVHIILRLRNFRMTAVATKNLHNLMCSELDEIFQKFCLTRVHIILRLRNFRMAAVATKNEKKVLWIGWNLC
jgi:hypothetical protein